MEHDVLVGAMYGSIVPFAMPLIAYWTRQVNYWAFFIVGALAIPVFAFVSMGIQHSWSDAVHVVLPRILTIDGVLIGIGFGVGTVVWVWIARLSGLERPDRVDKSEFRSSENEEQRPK